MAATLLSRFGRSLSCISRRGFSTACDDKLLLPTGKSMNLYSAINQALHTALETDPR
ncbi:hypothetical protein I3842_01G245800 [Carya illinoinensis]|uniref:Uncharacterized protein n=1 Tax=Carya illinoinensis TaxID=32201 RepID=A0A922G4G2_CARIL|nr:hypothetical protein I3842_01G245800 [Carya illinoinensis]